MQFGHCHKVATLWKRMSKLDKQKIRFKSVKMCMNIDVLKIDIILLTILGTACTEIAQH